MKRIQLIMILSFGYFGLLGQTNEYKRILGEKRSISSEAHYAKLKAFQKKNTQFSNVYYQLGESELGFFSEFDPIVNRAGSRHYIYNAKINFGLSKGFLVADEAIKYPEWYGISSKNKDSIRALVENHLTQKYQSVIAYSEAYEELISHYDQAVGLYLKAQQQFIEINTGSENLRELFLTADNSLKNAVKGVGLNFDSCIYHLDRYRLAYQQLPHQKKRKVKLNLQEIQHFRMNGITPSNFLSDEIDLWDYGQWSQNFSELLDEEVDGLRREVEEAYSKFLTINEQLMTGEECIQIDIDELKLQRIINLVTKYDSKSVLIDIFSYLGHKLKYGNQLVYERNCNEIESLPTDEVLSRKVRTLKNLYAELQVSDSVGLLVSTTTNNSTNFRWFFDKYMPGSDGNVTFSKEQIGESDKSMLNQLNEFNELIDIQFLNQGNTDSCYQMVDSVLISAPNIPKDSLTCKVKKLPISQEYEIAVLDKNDAMTLAGIKKVETGYEMSWKINPVFQIDFFKVLTDSSFIYGGISDRTWLVHSTSLGVEKTKIRLNKNDTIRNVYYNELLGSYTIVTGSKQDDSGNGYKVYVVGSNGKIKASQPLKIAGRFINLFVNEQKIWVFSESEGGASSMITATVFDNTLLQIGNPIDYIFSQKIFDPKVIKNDNKAITIIGGDPEIESGLIYSLIDYQGNINYETNYK